MSLDPVRQLSQATSIAQSTASQVLNAGEAESRISLDSLRDAVRRLSAMPGQRSIILVSPGFLALADLREEETVLIDRAIRANVVINSLNARGLYTVIPGGDASAPPQQSVGGVIAHSQYQMTSAQVEEDILAEVAYGTGGAFFHNNNDLVEGFKRVAARPEFIYVLGFSPQNLKLDGKFHTLKISLGKTYKLDLQAAHGLLCAASTWPTRRRPPSRRSRTRCFRARSCAISR